MCQPEVLPVSTGDICCVQLWSSGTVGICWRWGGGGCGCGARCGQLPPHFPASHLCGVWPSQRILSATLNRATTDGPHHSRHINIKLALHTFLFRFCVLCVLITVTHQRCTTECGITYQRVNKRTNLVKVPNYFVRKCYSKLNSFVLPNGMIK